MRNSPAKWKAEDKAYIILNLIFITCAFWWVPAKKALLVLSNFTLMKNVQPLNSAPLSTEELLTIKGGTANDGEDIIIIIDDIINQ